MDRREPDGRDAHFVEVVQPLGQPLQVTLRIAVAVGEAVDQYLVGDVGAFDAVPRIGLRHDGLAACGGVARLPHREGDLLAARGGEGECGGTACGRQGDGLFRVDVEWLLRFVASGGQHENRGEEEEWMFHCRKFLNGLVFCVQR